MIILQDVTIRCKETSLANSFDKARRNLAELEKVADYIGRLQKKGYAEHVDFLNIDPAKGEIRMECTEEVRRMITAQFPDTLTIKVGDHFSSRGLFPTVPKHKLF